MVQSPPTTTIHIRPMQIDDLAQVHAIDVQSFSMPWPLSSYRYELLENPASLQWVAEACSPDGACQVVGMIVVWLILDEAHIATIAVQADHRGRGIGRVLLAQALQASIRKGAHMATLEVRAGNQVAQEFYRGFEFEVVNRRPRYYRDNNEDALIMTISGLDRAYAAWLEKKKS